MVKTDPRFLPKRKQAKRKSLLQAQKRGDVVNEPIPGEQDLTIGVGPETWFNPLERYLLT